MLLCASAMWLCLDGVKVGADELRDPFTFGSRATTTTPTVPMLVGILWDATHPLAMIGDQTVGVGDRIGPCEVRQIQPDGVIVQCGAERTLLTPGSPLPH